MTVSRATLERWQKQAETVFATFKERRQFADELVHRDFAPRIDVRMGDRIADYRTPDLEASEQDFADILTMNPTRFAGVQSEQGQATEDAMTDAVLVAAHTWALIEDRGSWIDRSNAIGQTRYGLNVMRMLHHPIEEPDAKGKEAREEAMRKRPWPFYFEDTVVRACSWKERARRVQVFICETDIPVLQAMDDYAVEGSVLNKGKEIKKYEDGKKYQPYVMADNKLGWVGDGEVVDESLWEKTLKSTVIEYQDPERPCPICPDKHPLWTGVEIVRTASAKFKEGEIVQEYLLPYKHAGSFRVVPGRTTNDRDPHMRYRPLAIQMQVEAQIMNWALTMLQTLANRDASGSRVYGKLSEVPEDVRNRLPDEFWDKWSVPLPDTSANEIALLPPLEVWPSNLAPVLWDVYQDANRRFEAAKPNRFLLGENFQEAQQGTGSSNLQATQQAALPFNWLLAQSTNFLLEAKEDQFHAIRYWDHGASVDEEMHFYASLTGEEADYLKSGQAEAGKQVYVCASKLERGFRLSLVTQSETLQEQQDHHQEAMLLHDKGWLDAEQTVERLGFYDTDAQLRKLAKYRLQREMAPVKLQLQTAVLKTILAAVADIDPALLGVAQPQMAATDSGPDMTPPQPSVRLGPLDGPQSGASPVGAMA